METAKAFMDMEIIWCSLAFLAAIIFLRNILCLFKPNREKKLPPSPPSLPILGHLYIGLLKPPLHRILLSLSQRYGPIFSLQLGYQPAVVVSAPWAADQCFTQNDVVFANRPKFLMGQHLGYNHSLLIWAPHGPYWRNLRRVATLTTFSQKQIHLGGPGRLVEIRHMIRDLFWSCESGTRNVNLNEAFAKLARNLVMRAVIGKPCESTIISMPSNLMTVCDFVPVLKWVGYQGIEKKMIKLKKETDVALQGLVDECRNSLAFRRTGDVLEKKPMIDELLDLQEAEPDSYTDDTLKGLILVRG